MNCPLADALARADQALRHRRRRSQERRSDFLLAKTAQRFERQGHLRFARQIRMTAGEHHSQLVVAYFVVEMDRLRSDLRVGSMFKKRGDVLLLAPEILLAADCIERLVPGHSQQPGGRVSRDAAESPVLHRL